MIGYRRIFTEIMLIRLVRIIVVSILLRDIVFTWCFFSHNVPGVFIPRNGILHSSPS